jgi:hypothetical protein
MASIIEILNYNAVIISNIDGSNQIDLTNSITEADYYEDLFSPSVLMTIDIAASYPVLEKLPIVGGEAVYFDVNTGSGQFVRDKEFAMYVHKITNINTSASQESFRLHLCSMEYLTNETSRVQRKFQKMTIESHVIKIIREYLHQNKENPKVKNGIIEKTANPYSFIGTMKKPFNVLTWLAPKGIPSDSKSGTNGTQAKGTSGFLFYENYIGYNFRSINNLVKQKATFTYSTNDAIQSNNPNNAFAIIDHAFDRVNDLKESLTLGTYSNVTYFYDVYQNRVDGIVYNISNEVNSKSLLGSEGIAKSELFGSRVSRILVRTADVGILDPSGEKDDSGRDVADMSKSFSRYNLLFTQSLNIMVPMNINLKSGDVIKVVLQGATSGKDSPESDEKKSGNYLIKELRHHFEPNKMVTSLKLVRDSYGITE